MTNAKSKKRAIDLATFDLISAQRAIAIDRMCGAKTIDAAVLDRLCLAAVHLALLTVV